MIILTFDAIFRVIKILNRSFDEVGLNLEDFYSIWYSNFQERYNPDR